jgi:hypothetical protein
MYLFAQTGASRALHFRIRTKIRSAAKVALDEQH